MRVFFTAGTRNTYHFQHITGPFKSLFDFYERVDSKICGRASVEALIKCGAFDCFGAKRAQLMLAVEKALKGGQAAALDRERGQGSLFGFDEPEEETQNQADDPNVGLRNTSS